MSVLTRRAALVGGVPAALALRPRRVRAAQPIRLGLLTDMNGVYSEDAGPGSVVCAKLAIEDYKKIDPGLEVELLSADAGTSADTYVSLGREWYDRNGVDAIFDIPSSAAALALRTVAEQHDKALVITGSATSDLTGKACGPNHVQWVFDTYSLATSTAKGESAAGGKTWFFIQADYAMGSSMTRDAATGIEAMGGKVLGIARHPFPGTTDFSSFLLQAQVSGAQVLGLANGGTDAANTIKQAYEFGLTSRGMRIACMLFHITQIHELGLHYGQGILLSDPFYWDLNDQTRAFSKRFAPLMRGYMPASTQAGVYSAVLHYLKAVSALGVDAARASGRAAIARMKQIPTDDPVFGQGRVREDGRKLHPMYLFEVKSAGESRYPWDYYRLVRTTPAEQAFRPMQEGGCPMIRS